MSASLGALATFAYSRTGHRAPRRAALARLRWYVTRLRDGVRLWESPSGDAATAKAAAENAHEPGTYVVERVRP